MQLRDATSPGFFDFSGSQTAKTKAFIDAFNNFFAYVEDQEALFNDIYSNWVNRDYSSVTVARTPFVKKQLDSCGMGWFRGSEAQAARLAAFVLGGFGRKTVLDINSIMEFLGASPFNWLDIDSLQVSFGFQVPAYLSETLIVFSDSVGVPSTPSPTAYVERDWDAPSGWTKVASSSTYVSYGVKVGLTITWSAPYDASSIEYFTNANLSGLPAASAGDVVLVDDDGSDDVTSCYFYNGSIWQKFSTTYDLQGDVSDGVPADPSQSVVAAPDDSSLGYAISSNAQPPASGPSRGFGIYAGLSSTTLSANVIEIRVDLTEQGTLNLAVFVNLLRRIKPTLNRLFFIYTYDSIEYTIEISDSGEMS